MRWNIYTASKSFIVYFILVLYALSSLLTQHTSVSIFPRVNILICIKQELVSNFKKKLQTERKTERQRNVKVVGWLCTCMCGLYGCHWELSSSQHKYYITTDRFGCVSCCNTPTMDGTATAERNASEKNTENEEKGKQLQLFSVAIFFLLMFCVL